MLNQLLKLIVKKDGSDPYLSTGIQSRMKVQGRMLKIGKQILSGDDLRSLASKVMNEEQTKEKEQDS